LDEEKLEVALEEVKVMWLLHIIRVISNKKASLRLLVLETLMFESYHERLQNASNQLKTSDGSSRSDYIPNHLITQSVLGKTPLH